MRLIKEKSAPRSLFLPLKTLLLMCLVSGLAFKAPTHRPDVQLPYPITLQPLCCLLSDPFGRKVALKHTASTCCLLHSSVYVLQKRVALVL